MMTIAMLMFTASVITLVKRNRHDATRPKGYRGKHRDGGAR